MVRYYGYYSNAARGKRRKLGIDDAEIPEIAGQEADSAYCKKCRGNWARLIQKICEIDPLTCPNCNGTMRILAFIEEAAVIRRQSAGQKLLGWFSVSLKIHSVHLKLR